MLETLPERGAVSPDAPIETHLGRILATIEKSEWTGTLEVRSDDLFTALIIDGGVPVFAEAGSVADTLGRVLLRAGRLTPEQYTNILRRMTEALVGDEMMRFGEVAIELGYLSPVEVGEALGRQVREKVIHCLTLESATWELRADPDAASGVARYPTSVHGALAEALTAPGEGARWLERIARYGALYPLLRIESRSTMPGLTPARLRLLRMLDGTRAMASILREAQAPDDAAALLVMLMVLGRAELLERPVVKSTPPAPDRPSPSARAMAPAPEAARKLRENLDRGKPAAPPAPTEQRSRLTAEEAFERGRALLAKGSAAGAVPLFERAVELMPDVREYRLHLRFAELGATTDPELRRAITIDLEALTIEVLKEDRRCAFAHYVIARIAAAAGDDERAARSMKVATQLDPRDADAARWHRVLSARTSKR